MHNMYLWLLAFHIISMVAWMAGMFYLPRLFVYHSQVKASSQASELFKVMERRLLRLIINPAMVATWAFGIALIVKTNALAPGNGEWLHIKLGLVLLMQVVHAMLARARRQFARDERPHSARYYRILNEVPTTLLIIIVILAVVKPV